MREYLYLQYSNYNDTLNWRTLTMDKLMSFSSIAGGILLAVTLDLGRPLQLPSIRD